MDQTLSRRTLVQAAAGGTLAATFGSGALAQEATPMPAASPPTEASSSGPITIFEAKKIVTLHDVVPEATHVAVRDGRVLGAGALEDLAGWGDYTLDDTFKDLVIVPGLIEAHNHIWEGIAAFLPYVGYFDRPAVDGSTLKGITNFDDMIAYLKAEDAKLTDPNTPLIAFGFDPIYFWGQDEISKTTLDQVSTTRQVAIWYASEHTFMLNTLALQANDITAAVTDPGVLKGADGEPTGGLNSPPALAMAKSIAGPLVTLAADAKMIQAMAQFGLNAGCTMVTDIASTILAVPGAVEVWGETVNAPGFPTRVGIYLQTSIEGGATTPETIVDSVHTLRQSVETDKLRISGAKLVLDGSIQEFTAFLRWPGYYQGPNDVAGQLMTEEEIVTWMTPLQEAGIQIATHCNGDAAVDLLLNAVETVTAKRAAPNARYRVEHSQLTTPAQYERMATMGVCVNIFANHLWYWGDQHYEITVGPERAVGMEACATALAEGVPFSLHTDASVTPLGCLHSMWCAVNRVTPKGRVLGEAEKISAEEALRAVTLGSAYLLGLDEDLGSIQTGKWADFTVLAESPLDVEPMAIKDIAVWGTVLAGVKQPGAGAAGLGT
jgi:predicted amidohydrolase YtcJ